MKREYIKRPENGKLLQFILLRCIQRKLPYLAVEYAASLIIIIPYLKWFKKRTALIMLWIQR